MFDDGTWIMNKNSQNDIEVLERKLLRTGRGDKERTIWDAQRTNNKCCGEVKKIAVQAAHIMNGRRRSVERTPRTRPEMKEDEDG